MARLPDQVVEDLLQRYGQEELERVRGMIGSVTLREAARLIVDAFAGHAEIFIPHYWAEFYHDGHGSFGPTDARVLVFFADPDDDPRIDSGYPVRASELRRLTRDEYLEGLDRNLENKEAGLEPFMFVLPSVGPSAGEPFFDDLSRGAAQRLDPIALGELDAYVQEVIDEEGTEEKTATLRI